MYSLLMDQEAPLRHLYKALLAKLRSIDLIMVHIGMCTMDPSDPEHASLVRHDLQSICLGMATAQSI